MQEKERLDVYAQKYIRDDDTIEFFIRRGYIRRYSPYLSICGRCLEMGLANGDSVRLLAPLVKELVVVDASRELLQHVSDSAWFQEFKNVQLVESYFEDIRFEEEFDAVCCSFVLEHVIDPQQILEKCYTALKKGGYCLVTVPNARALSRQMAVEMGLLDNLYQLTENDVSYGHRRVFDWDILRALGKKTHFSIVREGGDLCEAVC